MEAFIARQPIFDLKQKVYAYELLFRSSMENVFTHSDLNQASSKVIGDSVFLMDMDTITGGKKAFINVTRETLVKDYTAVLPKDKTVVELLEMIEPDPEVLAACRNLKNNGYLLALDDFVYQDRYKPLLELADIIKVDFLATELDERRALVERLARKGMHFLAEKVETWEVYQEAVEMGYSYFQGYFFSKPTILSGKDIPGFKLHYLQILKEIQRPELDYGEFEGVIKREMSLSYKLLRYINSAFFGFSVEINSIRHAMVLLGENDVKKWASLLALASMADDKPDELVVQAVLRAKFCESLAPRVGFGARAQDLFLMGMFSLIDAIMSRPLPDVLGQMPIADDVKSALMGNEGKLNDIYQFVLAYERADWKRFQELAEKLKIDEEGISTLYLKALEWANQSFQTTRSA